MKITASFWKKTGLFLSAVALFAQLCACGAPEAKDMATDPTKAAAARSGADTTVSDSAEARADATGSDTAARTPEQQAAETPADGPFDAAGGLGEELTKIDAAAVILSTDVEDGYFDEVCSYRLEMPDVEYNEVPALEAIDSFFDALEDALEQYCGTTVYDEAMARNTVADVTGSFRTAQEGAKLTVVYTLRVVYADAPDTAQEFERTVAFDVRSGDVVEDSAS